MTPDELPTNPKEPSPDDILLCRCVVFLAAITFADADDLSVSLGELDDGRPAILCEITDKPPSAFTRLLLSRPEAGKFLAVMQAASQQNKNPPPNVPIFVRLLETILDIGNQ